MKASTVAALRDRVGSDKVHTADDVLDERRFDYWVLSHLRDWRGEAIERPGVVVRPESTAEVQAVVRLAGETGTPLVPFGLGSGVCGGIQPDPSVILLDLSAMNRVRERIRALTDRRRRAGMKDIREVIRDLNPVLRGWGNYFRTGNASLKFQQVDRYVNQRLVRLMSRGRRDRTRPFINREWPPARLVKEFGLHRLVGTVRYPGSAHAT